jgi:hypothetical protein
MSPHPKANFMPASFFPTFILLLFFSCLTTLSHAGAIVEGNTADGMVTQTAVNTPVYHENENLWVGTLDFGVVGTVVDGFPLPYLGPNQQITGASASFYLNEINNAPGFNAQLYGLNRVSTSNPAPLVSDWYAGTNDTANVLLDSTFLTPQSTINQSATYSGANLVTFVQNQYKNASFAGGDLSATRYIFFRVSPTATTGNESYYQIASARHPTRACHPTLSLTISNGVSNIAGRLQFSFNLPTNAVTSAGVYNSSTGALIRTLWNNVQYQQGTNYGVWNGNDDNGVAVATGSSYQIKLIYHNVQYVYEGIVGNTSASQSGFHVYRSCEKICDMSIAGGQAYYAVNYNESVSPFHAFVVGAPQVPNILGNVAFSDPYSEMNFVTSDGVHTYWAKCQGGVSPANTYVIGMNDSDGSFYTFPQGSTPTGSNQDYTSCTDYDATAGQPNSATGIAVQKSGNDLFVSHGNLNVIRVFDKVQGTSLGSFSVPNPGRLCTTANGDVWVISGTTTLVVKRYTFANGTATLKQTISTLSDPVGLGVSADDSLLLVADGGSSQQIKAFTNSNGNPAWTYGLPGGMYTNGPNVTTNDFDFTTATFITFQADNTFWIGDVGNTRNLHFSINGNTLIYVEQISYSDLNYQVAVDLTDTTRVFNRFFEYSVNYSLPLGGTNGSWTLVKNWVYGLPNDSTHNYTYDYHRQGFFNVITLSNGHTYGLINNYANLKIDLVELPATGMARLTGYEFETLPRIYPDGTLRFNTSSTTNLSFYSEPLLGFDSQNNPKWGPPVLLATTALAATDPKTWVPFTERTEVTAGGIVVDYDGNQNNTGYHLGGIKTGGTAWQWRSSPSTTFSYSGWFPQDGHFDIGNGVNYAGNVAMALGRNIICGYHGELWKDSEASQWLNFMDNGLMVGLFGTLGVDTSFDQTSDGFAGNSFAPTLVYGPNGKVYLYHNDEGAHGGVDRWRIDGWDGITEVNAVSTIGSTISLSPVTTGPTVNITSPTSGATYVDGHNLTLSVQAASSGASITNIQFFDGSTSLGSVSVAPFTLNISSLSPGAHTITARGTDSNGLTATSSPVAITVGADGASTPPPTPTSLSSGSVASQSVSLAWVEPAMSTTSSTIGQRISFQFASANESFALTPASVAGAPAYSSSNFNLVTTLATNGPVFINPLNSSGVSVPNMALNLALAGRIDGASIATLTGTAQDVFQGEAATDSVDPAITVSYVPYALYDLVVYSLAEQVDTKDLASGAKTDSLILNDGIHTSTVQQTFNAPQTGYNVATVPFGSNLSTTNQNTIVFQGVTAQTIILQGNNVESFQIVERPYDQGTPTTYNIQRSPGTTAAFTTVGTSSGTTPSFTDTTNLSPSTMYQYRVQAVNSFGSSTYSNPISVTTLAAGSSPTSPPPTTPTPPPSTPSSSFAGWQSQYFTAAQLADQAISGATADPYGSGVPNLLAYALKLNPATARLTDVPQAMLTNGHLTLTYFAPSSITDITYVVEVSSDLMTWNSGAGYIQVTSTVPNASGNTITVQDLTSTSVPKHFMRLRVTQNQ